MSIILSIEIINKINVPQTGTQNEGFRRFQGRFLCSPRGKYITVGRDLPRGVQKKRANASTFSLHLQINSR
jgi:hypothetical protein